MTSSAPSEPSEISPLLSSTSNRNVVPHVDPSAPLVPEGAEEAVISYGSTNESGTSTQVDTPISRSSTAKDNDVERQDGTGSNHAQAGDERPEARQQMKYIMPALSIGIFLAAADQTIIVSSYGKIGTDLNALNSTSWIATA
jgi:hypothetical protein